MAQFSGLHSPPGIPLWHATVAAMPHAWGAPALALPFDLLRWAYAAGVHSGAIRRSLLASHQFDRALVAAEQLALGPFARRR
jgi:hypothetical protein